MIKPSEVTKFDRTQDELSEFAIFAACVAGKNADQTAQKVNALFADPQFRADLGWQHKFPIVDDTRYERDLAEIDRALRAYKIGQYDRLSRVICFLNRCDLNRVTFNELVNFKGIGPKTAAFFLLHSRANFNIPCIDTHICKYMATKGITMKVTSNVKKYLENAKLVAEHMKKDFPAITIAEADLILWLDFSGRKVEKLPKNQHEARVLDVQRTIEQAILIRDAQKPLEDMRASLPCIRH